jgi:hypothetical protein
VAEQDQEAGGVSSVPPPSSAVSDSPLKATASPPKPSNSPSKGWFIGGLKGFFGPRQVSTPQSSPTRQRSTKSTKTLPPPSSTTETSPPTTRTSKIASPPNRRGSMQCLANPQQSKNRNGKRGRTIIYGRSPRSGGGTALMVFLLGMWGCVGWVGR